MTICTPNIKVDDAVKEPELNYSKAKCAVSFYDVS